MIEVMLKCCHGPSTPQTRRARKRRERRGRVAPVGMTEFGKGQSEEES